MLSVQRTTVTQAAMSLQFKGVIRYSRGKIDLLDLPRLEALACPCRAVLSLERARMATCQAIDPHQIEPA